MQNASLTVASVSKHLRVSEELVRRKIKQKKLPAWTRPLCNRQWLVCAHFMKYLLDRGRPPACAFLMASDPDWSVCRKCTVPRLIAGLPRG